MRRSAPLPRVICFHCRKSDCACVADHNAKLAALKAAGQPRSQVIWACAWVGGACLAGSVLGALLALLLGS